jgi:hypothetical protein
MNSNPTKSALIQLTIVLLVSLSGAVAPAFADTDETPSSTPGLRPFKAEYALYHDNTKLGEVIRTLSQNDKGDYIFESISNTTGWVRLFVKDEIIERSVFTLVDGNPRPSSYLYDRHGGKKKRHVKLLFDWDKMKVTNIIDNDPWTMEIPAGTQDKLLYQLTMMLDLQAKERDFNYEVADGGRLKDYVFTFEGPEQIKTPLGRLDTVRLVRHKPDLTITIWLAPKLGYMPARIEQEEKKDGGDKLRLSIQSVIGR